MSEEGPDIEAAQDREDYALARMTENEQVIVLQGERIAELEAELSQANSDRQREHDLRVTLASQVESLQSKCAHCPRPLSAG